MGRNFLSKIHITDEDIVSIRPLIDGNQPVNICSCRYNGLGFYFQGNTSCDSIRAANMA